MLGLPAHGMIQFPDFVISISRATDTPHLPCSDVTAKNRHPLEKRIHAFMTI
jgi:hypothetical protein